LKNGLHQNKKFLHSQEIISRIKRKLKEWEKIFASYLSDKGLNIQNTKRAPKLKMERINNPINKRANQLNSFQRKYKWLRKYMKKVQYPLP
jgi:hypothetical protein